MFQVLPEKKLKVYKGIIYMFDVIWADINYMDRYIEFTFDN